MVETFVIVVASSARGEESGLAAEIPNGPCPLLGDVDKSGLTHSLEMGCACTREADVSWMQEKHWATVVPALKLEVDALKMRMKD